jgi:cobalt/nickel transport system permease protein
MRLDASGDPGKRISPVHRLDARVKLVFTLAFVIAVVATPIGQWRILGILGLLLALVVGISGAEVRALLLRWAGFALVVGFLAVMVAPGLPARAKHGLVAVFLSIVVKNSLAFLMMLVLATVSSWLDLLQAMRRLGVPRVLVATLQFMERYVHLLGEELARMAQARAARTFQRGSLLSWRLLTGMLGLLLLRSFERAERVHSAMLARGWDGTIHHLN